jgi:hypothetical protein
MNGNQGPPPSDTKLQTPVNNLLNSEKVFFSDDVTKAKTTDEELNSRYAKGDIRIVTESARYSIAGILAMLSESVELEGTSGKKELRYKLDPEYQRRHRWNIERKSRLIESFLMNVPVPPVFLYERDLARYEVMDGRQRLTALSEFYSDQFALTGLQYWADLDGRKYSELPSKVRDGIDRRYISSVILLKETAATEEQATFLKKIVFERLNSGGVKLGSQETRNAVYGGPLNQLCLKLSENATFRRMWGIPLDPNPGEHEEEEDVAENEPTQTGIRMFEKMEDVELVLRFFAYRHIQSFRAGLNKISEFLDRFLIGGNRFPENLLADYESMFESTVSFLSAALETEAFCVIGGTSRRPTKIVYDPIMFVANSEIVVAHRPQLVAQKGILREELSTMYQNNQALFAGRRTNFADTQQRNLHVHGAFAAAIAKIENT